MISMLVGEPITEQSLLRLKQAKNAIYYESLQVKEIRFCAGALACLARFQHAHIPQALVSATVRRNIEFYCTQTPLATYMKTIVSRDDVLRGKPDPEPFLLAAQRLGVAPQHCIVIGDTVADIQGGRAAGMTTIAVRATIADLEGDVTVESLEDITEELLAAGIPVSSCRV